MEKKMKEYKYEDMLMMPHHQSSKRPHMTMRERAAQFAPFAALTGHDEAIVETARYVESKLELEEDVLVELDERLGTLKEKIKESPRVSITYFRPDMHKKGGTYITISGTLKKIDEYKQKLILEEGDQIAIRDIVRIEERIF